MAYDAEIIDLETVRGGARRYPNGLLAFVTFGNEDTQERVTMSSYDGAGLALALRRAADQLDGSLRSPFNLPPVLETMGEFAARAGG